MTSRKKSGRAVEEVGDTPDRAKSSFAKPDEFIASAAWERHTEREGAHSHSAASGRESTVVASVTAQLTVGRDAPVAGRMQRAPVAPIGQL